MNAGPSRKLMSSAVTIAYADRNVMYRNTLKTDISVCSGYSR
jgi:hypothetical protein